ncbi:MAG: glycoside hydrolase family 3 C-terminal domain-containing protein [Anaerolineae bacterium]|nr:glycoside hydrolase family 3 C-terminal domain-containing protein [Anaerolineae bacterium]
MLSESLPPYKDPGRSIEERVEDLVSRMTLEEKISQMVYDAPAIERLDVPAYNWWSECLHGVGRAGLATVFPQAIGLAATWNTDLVYRVATAISDEARAKHHDAVRKGIYRQYFGLSFWSPTVNIFRDPRWGRGQETYGECPYLTARMGVAFVKGLQGDDPRYLKLVATPKHFAVHSGPEPERHTFDAVVDERDLRETYLPHFEACIKEGGAFSIMGAYNRTNGEPCCASPTLLENILRQEWGFEGYVVSDCDAIYDIYAHHKVAATPAEAAAMAVKAGCDLNCGRTYPALLEAVEKGLIDEATINRAVKRLFTARFRLGMFDPSEQVPYTQIPYEVVDSPAHRELALQAARESIVLLKNDGLLPLSKSLHSIAVIGPNADSRDVLLGNYNGTPSYAVTVLEGIRKKLPSATIYYAPGCELAEGMPELEVIPSNVLRPVNPEGWQNGLTGSYYSNTAFEGEPAVVRVDPLVNFVWKSTTPVTGCFGDGFSVRWEGTLVPPKSGTYRLGVKGCNSYRLYLDGSLIIELGFWYSPIVTHTEVALEAGRIYDLRLEYACTHFDHDPMVQLLWSPPGLDLLQQATEVADKAEVIIVVLGLSPLLEGEEMPIEIPGFRGGDRTDINLPRPQEELLRRLHALGKPIVLVLLNGSALAINWAAEHTPAIVEAWYPGQAGGEAVADVLFGDYNPAGRLPVTFYKSVADLPPFEDYRMEGRTYRYFRGEPLFPFGYGLSYTTFAYSNLRLSAQSIAPDETLTVSVDVHNTGSRAGDEVVQLYVSDLEASVPVPIRQLAGFMRVHLNPGEVRTVTFSLAPRQLSLIDNQGQRIVEPGQFQIAVGGCQPGSIPAAGEQVLTAVFEVRAR